MGFGRISIDFHGFPLVFAWFFFSFSSILLVAHGPQVPGERGLSSLPLEQALDALTYVRVEFCHPADGRCVGVVALVDTGSNDCDLNMASIDTWQLI